MALATYDDLVESIIKWSHRKDILDLIPDFIKLAESEMYDNPDRGLTVREMETLSTALTSGQRLALPDEYEKARSARLIVSDGGGELQFQSPEQLIRNSASGRPRFFTVIGGEFLFDRVPDSNYTIEVQYYKKPAPLTIANQTNIIITNHPTIYLYGALKHLFVWSMVDDQAVKYDALFQDAIKGANRADKKGRYGPTPKTGYPSNAV